MLCVIAIFFYFMRHKLAITSKKWALKQYVF
jgi:hypothetical protein